MTDAQLVARMRKGEEASYLLLYQRFREPVFRFAYRLTGTVEAAEDITHDCFLALASATNSFDPLKGALRSYLFGTVRNLTWKRLRLKEREEALEANSEIAATQNDPLDTLLDKEVSLLVAQAVAELPFLQREVLVLFEFEEFSLVEISQVVGAEVGVVKSRLHRARERLRKGLAHVFNRPVAERGSSQI